MKLRRWAPILAVALLSTSACSKMRGPSFPAPARPGVLVPMGYEQAFGTLASLAEARGMPVLVSDEKFGNIRTDWVYYDPGQIDLRGLAECNMDDTTAPTAVRVRYGFDVRKRANRATVTILTHYQAETHKGFDGSDRGYIDCRSTGEWERLVEQSLTQRTIPR